MKIEEILSRLSEEKTLVLQGKYVAIRDEQEHTLELYEIDLTSGELEKINLDDIVEEIAEYLKDKVNIKLLLKDFLRSKLPEEVILKLYERVKLQPKVTDEEGCYKIRVGGKRGRPLELYLVDPV